MRIAFPAEAIFDAPRRIGYNQRMQAHQSLRLLLPSLAAFFAVALPSCLAVADEQGDEFFEKQVRPILVSRCFDCHSGKLADGAKEPKGNLRLDSLEAAKKGGDTGPAVVPGNLKESLLVDAINYGQLYQMPPKTKLPAEEIATLTKWVEMGAPWPKGAGESVAAGDKTFDLAKRKADHWCWQPVKKVAPPVVRSEAWPRQPLDRFILAKLEEKGITPSLPADKRTLLRRAYFDLIGLPPKPEEVEAFLKDESPQAFEKVVDGLLNSPQFGERWGRHWLDLVRYAESRGHEFEPNIPNAWQYRDYVIRALNADVPFDRFVTEHIAGDLVPQPRLHPTEKFNESILGTGFWFLGEEVHSPVDIRKDETDRLDNRLDVMTKTFLGVTVTCARCHESLEHNRKIAAELETLRADARREMTKLTSDSAAENVERIAEYLLAAREAMTSGAINRVAVTKNKLSESLLKNWIAELTKAKGDKTHPLHCFATGDFKPLEQKDRIAVPQEQILVDYTRPDAPWYQDGFSFGSRPVQAGEVRLGSTPDQPLAGVVQLGAAELDATWPRMKVAAGTDKDHGGLGNWDRMGQTLRTAEVTLKTGNVWYLVRGSGRAYAAINSHLVIAGPLHGAILREWDGKPVAAGGPPAGWQWVNHNLSNYTGHRLHFEFTPKDGEMAVAMVVDSDKPPPAIWDSTADVAGSAAATPDEFARQFQTECQQIVKTLAENKLTDSSPATANYLVTHLDLFSPTDSEPRQKLRAVSEAFLKKQQDLQKQIKTESHTALAMLDGNSSDELLLIRGNSRTPAKAVSHRFLEAIAGPQQDYPSSSSGRLELAKKITDPANPLTSRVFVNRIWHHLFGRGLVASVDNFGVLGERPSHPELLDYLASEFVADGWSMKRAIKRMMLSATYQQGSGVRSQGSGVSVEAVDPQNLLLHRANVKRLEGEVIRDSILAISGRLDRKQFGPSVPVNLTNFMQGRGRPAVSGPLDGDGRRSIYISVRRNFLSPMMLAFDTPIPFSTIGRRNISNVPAQALILMNDPLVSEQAKLWARQILAGPAATPENRIRRMYLAAFSREPLASETESALAFLDSQGREYGIAQENARNDERVWADLAHVLYNVKEFVFVE
ncbi:MAG: PSD1 and planctomycete cytochrome C domain-containing protein [Planctomycetales bacterium]|nr:PSD1 and planctomycete cytochrome C domain-containing protein [Planctomycetales bacterium]